MQQLTRLSVHASGVVLATAFALSVFAGYLSLTQLGFTSDTTGLIEQDKPFRVHYDEFKEAFPQLVQTILLVVDAEDPAALEETSKALINTLNREPELFPVVFLAEEHPFFKQNGLLFLEIEELEEIVEKLAEAQPALTTIAADPSLIGLLKLFDLGLDALEEENDIPPGFTRLATEIARTARAVEQNSVPSLQWTNTLLAANDAKFRNIIVIQPRLDLASSSAGRAAVKRLRNIAASPPFSNDPRITIRTTGRVALSYDELEAVREGVELAGVVSLLFLAVVLSVFLRSPKLILANFLTLIAGLIWTLGFAAITVGHLNMLSAAFAVLFVGLGIDHAIHFSLRFSEAIKKGVSREKAIEETSNSLIEPLALCSLSSAIGFSSFLPTDYQGLAELGIIAAGGMGFAFLATITVLPAAIIKLNVTRVPQSLSVQPSWLVTMVEKNHRAILLGATSVLCISLVPASQIKFDFSTLAIKDRQSESVSTLIDLQRSGDVTDYTSSIVVKDQTAAMTMAAKLESLPGVSEVETLDSLVPNNQEIKLELVGEAVDFLWPVFRNIGQSSNQQSTSTNEYSVQEAVSAFNKRVLLTDPEGSEFASSLHTLSDALARITASSRAQEEFQSLEDAIVPAMTRQLERLALSLSAEQVSMNDIPIALQQQFVATDGRVRVVVKPREEIVGVESLNRFVDTVSEVAPRATGRPAVEAGVGRIVTRSLYEAASYAIGAVFIILLFIFRSPRYALLVMIPLAFSASFTVATASLIGLSFNFANVIVLPLIFGLGVDSGIHFVTRRQNEASIAATLESSTPRAVGLSALTTIGAFSSLSLSPHAGTASMGILLTISLFWIVIGTVVILPALLKWQEEKLVAKSVA